MLRKEDFLLPVRTLKVLITFTWEVEVYVKAGVKLIIEVEKSVVNVTMEKGRMTTIVS